jgi:hypothetical protein
MRTVLRRRLILGRRLQHRAVRPRFSAGEADDRDHARGHPSRLWAPRSETLAASACHAAFWLQHPTIRVGDVARASSDGRRRSFPAAAQQPRGLRHDRAGFSGGAARVTWELSGVILLMTRAGESASFASVSHP